MLFLCTHNAGRSQMALGFFQHHAGDARGRLVRRLRTRPPASTRPPSPRWPSAASTSPTEYPKPWTDEVVRAADVVITMGCGDACPVFPGKRYEEWTLDDPAGLDVADVRPIRDEVERHVLTLLAELDLPSRTTA